MNTKIDIKSTVIGLAMGVLVALGLPLQRAWHPGRAIPDNKQSKQWWPGGSHSLVIDTVTGKVWLGYVSSSGRSDEEFFQPKSSEK